MLTDSFRGDLQYLFEKLKNSQNFSFSKYADGEFAILRNLQITNTDKWTFSPEKHSHVREELMKSFTYRDSQYYVGVSCKCCQPEEDVLWMRKKSGQERLTWANIFVNSNYPFFLNNFIPEFSKYEVVLFARDDARIEDLPFNVEHVPISRNAFVYNFDLVDNFPIHQYTNKLFLFCAGPLGNMLAASFWRKNKTNTYLDIGSTLNPYLTEPNRGYLNKRKSELKTCVW